jgi:hypothetical protein
MCSCPPVPALRVTRQARYLRRRTAQTTRPAPSQRHCAVHNHRRFRAPASVLSKSTRLRRILEDPIPRGSPLPPGEAPPRLCLTSESNLEPRPATGWSPPPSLRPSRHLSHLGLCWPGAWDDLGLFRHSSTFTLPRLTITSLPSSTGPQFANLLSLLIRANSHAPAE